MGVRVALTETPVDLYAETGYTGQIDVQNISAVTIRVAPGGTAATSTLDYNVMQPSLWIPFNDTTVMAFSSSPGAAVIVTQL